jgi:hypothetical protein
MTGVIAVVVFLIIVGATSGKSSSTPQKVADNTSQATLASSAPTASVAPANQTFNVGDVVKLGEYQFTVNNVKKLAQKGYSSPKSGNEYVIVNFTIQNTGDKEVNYNPYDFKIQDSNGNQTNETFVSLDDSLNAGSLAAGGKVTGSIPFEAPKGDKALKLIYQPSLWQDDKRVTVNLQ